MINKSEINKPLMYMAYIYLALPVIIFLLGWCRWYIGIPVSGICCVSIYYAVNERKYVRKKREPLSFENKFISILVLIIIMCWVGLSGIGGYAWQNSDHPYRNTIFGLLMNEQWPVISGARGLTYYIGFWFPAAIIGKMFGPRYGASALFFWAVIGIILVYALLCQKRRKIEIWPLLIIVFFSGMDIVGTNLLSVGTVEVFGVEHIERWPSYFQYTSNTAQLFWVFNQAIPAWLATTLVYEDESPRNFLFLASLLMISSTLPFIGLLPFLGYYSYERCTWNSITTVGEGCKQLGKNCGSFQNLVGGSIVAVISFFYLMGNENFMGILNKLQELIYGEVGGDIWFVVKILVVAIFCVALVGVLTVWLISKKKLLCVIKRIGLPIMVALVAIVGIWKYIEYTGAGTIRHVYIYLITLVFFLVLEVGTLLYCLYREEEKRTLFYVLTLSLCVIPVIIVGESIDFCMRASIPALFILMLWCIDIISKKKKQMTTYLLIGSLLVGAVTGIHEIKRSYSETIGGYSLQYVEEHLIMNGTNFSGTTETFFWKYLAK